MLLVDSNVSIQRPLKTLKGCLGTCDEQQLINLIHESRWNRVRDLRAQSFKMRCRELAPLLVELIEPLDATACSLSILCRLED